jgi:hypothetical protein
MTAITIDAVLRDKLSHLSQPVDLVDESGRLVGRFTPAGDLSGDEQTGPQISEEEIQRRSRRRGGRTLAEIMADLEKRG